MDPEKKLLGTTNNPFNQKTSQWKGYRGRWDPVGWQGKGNKVWQWEDPAHGNYSKECLPRGLQSGAGRRVAHVVTTAAQSEGLG